MSIRILLAAVAATIIAAPGVALAQVHRESRRVEDVQGTQFFAFNFPETNKVEVIVAFDLDTPHPDNIAAIAVRQTIDCETRRITTAFASYGDDGGLLHEGDAIPSNVATAVHADRWATTLNHGCAPPPPIPNIAIDPPPAYDRQFEGEVTNAAEAIALLHARVEARSEAAALSPQGRWGTFSGHYFTGGYFIDYAATDAEHVSFLVAPGQYEQDWRYARARYRYNCATRNAHVEYFVRYNASNEVIGVDGPTREAPMTLMRANAALTAICNSRDPSGRTQSNLNDAVESLRRQTAQAGLR